MATNSKMRAKGGVWSLDGRRLTAAFMAALALSVFAWAVKADTWTGAGQNSATQNRDWIVPGNWFNNAVPGANEIDRFQLTGDGNIALLGNQSAGGLIFDDFTATNLYPDPAGPAPLTLTFDSGGVVPKVRTGETLRDTYGVDYFTTGPELAVDLQLNANPQFYLGSTGFGANADNSAMLVSGIINPAPGKTINYYGYGTGTSLWFTNTSALANVNVNVWFGAGGGSDGYTLHLADNGRLNGATIYLQSQSSYLGLHDTQNNPAAVNSYIHTSYSNIFVDRSYQLNDMNNSINVLQTISNTVESDHSGTYFGSTGTFGRTNNGYSLRVSTLKTTANAWVYVNNGNLTEDRGGSRYVSGANRLQEAHNYTYAANLNAAVQSFTKFGAGVLAIEKVNNAGVWPNAPSVQDGVLRLGLPAVPHSLLAGQISLGLDGGVGIGWDTTINLNAGPPLPLAITPSATVPGQSGAIDPDLWNFLFTTANPLIDPNVMSSTGPMTYLRIGSSKGGDASFDPQPLAAKHASIAFMNNQDPPLMTQIIPYVVGPETCNIYYFGGGGGTLQVDAQLNNYQERNTMFEMGTTGTLLPGRVALNPGGEGIEEANTYTGATEICAGTLQLMKQGSVWSSQAVSVWTYDQNITNGLYANPSQCHHWWEGANFYTWTGPGQLLLDPGRDPNLNPPDPKDWSLGWYRANGGQPLHIPGVVSNLFLDGGVIGWTADVNLTGVPGSYGATVNSNLTGVFQLVNVLGLGGEYSAGTMVWQPLQPPIGIGDNGQNPVLLYKAGKNSALDLTQNQGIANTYTGGTIIAGGEIIVNDANQLNAHEDNENGGPICILNGGRLHIIPGVGVDTNFAVPIRINTAGTPDTVKNCGSVIEVDGGVTASLWANFDFSWAPTRYLEKDGQGTLVYSALAPAFGSSANAWGLKLTDGLVVVNQLPVNNNTDSGPVIFNGGDLQVTSTQAGVMTGDLAYGFRNIVSFQSFQGSPLTDGTVTVDDTALFRTHGIVPNEILGTVNFVGNDADSDTSNNIVHLSRNMASVAAAPTPGDYSRGDGAMTFQDVTVYMTGGGSDISLNVLPRDAGFILQLNDGVQFKASHQNNVYGEVNFNNLTPANPAKWVRIDGEEANADRSIFTSDTWTIYGTGYTTWSGTTEKMGPGTVAIKRALGTEVSLNANTFLLISGGTFEAGGLADPFTDTATVVSLDIQNDSILLISDGAKVVDVITGSGDTIINGPSGTQLTVTSIAQGRLSIAAGNKLVIKGALSGPLEDIGVLMDVNPVPEPSTWLLLSIAALGLHIIARRRK